MTESNVAYAEQETQRLNTDIEALQKKICFLIETRDAWERILHDAGFQTHSVCLELAAAEKERLNSEIEAMREKIHSCFESIVALNGPKQSAGSELHSSEMERLNGQAEPVQEAAIEKMDCPVETQSALNTMPRYAQNETRVYQGATYVMGADRKWHLQRTEPTQVRDEVVETVSSWMRTAEAEPAAESMWQSFRSACERILGRTEKDADLAVPDKGSFLSLGLN